MAIRLCLLALFVGAAGPVRAIATERPGPAPNLIVILADDLGYGDLGSYGAEQLRTPHIDALVVGGLRFDNFYANCPVCSPTRASLLTGRYPELVGVPGVIRTHAENSWGQLSAEAILLPRVLKQAGYRTAAIGKWHLGLSPDDSPNARGFDHFRGFLGDMMDDYYTHRRHGINYMRHDGREIAPQGHATDLFSQWACDFLKDQAGSESPFFLYLAYNAPHTPIQPPEDWLAKVRQRAPEVPLRRARLMALIEHMDAGIGRVLDCLQETGEAENTLVVFTSDNGGQVDVGARNGAWRDGKQSMYEGGLRVPAAIRWPNQIAPGSRTAAVCLTMDLFPTLCAVAGVSIQHPIEGLPLNSLWTEPGSDLPARDVFFHRREGGARYGGLTIQAIRRGPWKLLQNSPFAPLELYNLQEDPQEQNDLASARPGEFRQLSEALRLQIQRGGAVPWQPAARQYAPAASGR